MRSKNFFWIIVACGLIFFFTGSIFAQTLKINEVVPANFASATDEDGDNPDWIEIVNSGTDPVNLLNYGLSDDQNDLLKWTFPDMVLDQNEHALVFASSKNRRINACWETIIDEGDDWKYFVGMSAPPSSWRAINFDDTNWLQGPSGFGYRDGDDNTEISEIGHGYATSIFIRKTFIVNDVSDVLGALLHIDFDDAFIVWLNEVEIARENIGYYGSYPAYNDTIGISVHEAEMYSGGLPNHYYIDDIQSLLQYGNNTLSIEVHTLDTDMSMIPFFTRSLQPICVIKIYGSPGRRRS